METIGIVGFELKGYHESLEAVSRSANTRNTRSMVGCNLPEKAPQL